jgi:predicted ArsR family transcriptional regulator
MYKYRLKEQGNEKVKKFHEERIMAFDSLESRLENIKKLLRQGKIETIKYYRENPDSYSVLKATDLINDYINDIETLLKGEE